MSSGWAVCDVKVTKLVENYRSHPALIHLPSQLFYTAELVVSAEKSFVECLCAWDQLPNRNSFPILFHGVGVNILRCWLCPVLAWYHCRISPPCFLAECCTRRLNQGSFVLLCLVLFAVSGLCLVFVVYVFLFCLLSCIFQCEPTWLAAVLCSPILTHLSRGDVWRNRLCVLHHIRTIMTKNSPKIGIFIIQDGSGNCLFALA